MPRTRTKFVWPPVNNSSGPENPSPTEAPTAKRRRGPPASAAPREQPEPGGERSRKESSAPMKNDLTQRPSSPSQSSSWQRADRASNLVSGHPIEQLPLDAQVKQYQEWRRKGAIHDDFCYICHLDGSLIPCQTCRGSLHNACMPTGGSFDSQTHFYYCSVCVRRNWHHNPPAMSPPASPPPHPPQSTSSENASTSQDAIRPDPGRRSQPPFSTFSEMSRSTSWEASSKPTTVSAAPSALGQQMAPPLPSGPLPWPWRANEPSTSPSPSQGISPLDSHPRKSRFSTLSPEVDSALWVLCREVESTNSLRQQIAELEAQAAKLRQEISIRDNQLILSQRAVRAERVPQAEIDCLRTRAEKGEAAVREVEALRARNETLEKELKEARAVAEAMNETLNEWKGKLSNMIAS